MNEGEFFPYEQFAVWLQDAMTAGKVVMKLMIAAGPERQIVDVTPTERELLADVHTEVGQYPTMERLAGLASRSSYPVLSVDQIQAIWNVLTAHLASDERYAGMRESFTIFLDAHPTAGILLMDTVSCFCPTLAPRGWWRCALPQSIPE